MILQVQQLTNCRKKMLEAEGHTLKWQEDSRLCERTRSEAGQRNDTLTPLYFNCKHKGTGMFQELTGRMQGQALAGCSESQFNTGVSLSTNHTEGFRRETWTKTAFAALTKRSRTCLSSVWKQILCSSSFTSKPWHKEHTHCMQTVKCAHRRH